MSDSPAAASDAAESGVQDAPLKGLRVALFSGNYNYVRDGANQALNRLVGYLQRQGAQVHVFAPKVKNPAFPSMGKLIGLPSLPVPGRGEYRIPMFLGRKARSDLRAFQPNVVHVSSPDFAAHRAVTWARARKLPVLASVHTRFDTYPRYYNLAWIEPALTAILRRFYRRCDGLVAPSESMAQVLREERMNYDISLWSRGVDRTIFNPERRDLAWRRSLGIADDEVVIGFLGRLVMEKGLDVFSDTIDQVVRRGTPHARSGPDSSSEMGCCGRQSSSSGSASERWTAPPWRRASTLRQPPSSRSRRCSSSAPVSCAARSCQPIGGFPRRPKRPHR